MKNSLQTNIKAEIDNNRLPYIGKIKFHYPVNSTKVLNVGTNGYILNYNMQLLTSDTGSDIGFYHSGEQSDPSKCLGKDVDFNGAMYYDYVKTGSDENAIVLADKDRLQYISCSATGAKIDVVSGELLNCPNLKYLSLNSEQSSVNPISIHDLSECTLLQEMSLYSSRVYGSIYELSSILTLTSLGLQWTNLLAGSLDVLFDAWAEAGKTGVCRVIANGSNLYYQGEVVGSSWDKDVTFADGGWTIAEHS